MLLCDEQLKLVENKEDINSSKTISVNVVKKIITT